MMSSASSMRAIWSSVEGQSSPTGTSLSASPEPIPRYGRPGYMRSNVIHAWAISAGWKRAPGGVTAVPNGTLSVACAAAPSHAQAWPDSPGSHHGCR
jgi:hypothetical protein